MANDNRLTLRPAGDLSTLGKATDKLFSSISKLSSGRRINKASDDPAGLAVADSLSAAISQLSKGTQNISDGGSLLAIRDGATAALTDVSTRLSELATQSANGTLSDTQRSALNDEFQALKQEVNRIAATTEFNGQKLLQGEDVEIQAGTSGSDPSSRVAVEGSQAATQIQSVLNSLDVSSLAGARDAIDKVANFTSTISEERATIGAAQSRLDVARNNNITSREALAGAESRIRDADIAEETANFTGNQIRQQANVAILAQAKNILPNLVSKLLG
jgi:flagellin